MKVGPERALTRARPGRPQIQAGRADSKKIAIGPGRAHLFFTGPRAQPGARLNNPESPPRGRKTLVARASSQEIWRIKRRIALDF